MLVADALTHPIKWRGCAHVYDGPDTPRRCLACRAVDHGAVRHVQSPRGGMAGYRMTDAMPPEAEQPKPTRTLCPEGHALTVTQMVTASGTTTFRHRCATCIEDRRQAALSLPCPRGHVGERRIDSGRGVRCNACAREVYEERKAARA